MTKQWKPGRETVAIRPSRIRRDPIRLDTPRTVVPTKRSRERDIWAAMFGVALFAISVATIVVGVSIATDKHGAPAAATAAPLRFDYCRGDRRVDCVVNGARFFLGSDPIAIAGIDIPDARSSSCSREARLGVDSTVRLRRMLNDGTVTLEGTAWGRDKDGALLRKVEVNGVDVGRVMIAAGLARDLAGGQRSWC